MVMVHWWVIFCLTAWCFVCVFCQDFGYDGTEGPIYWGNKYEKCLGKHQSPIDIEEHDVKVVRFSEMHFENFSKHLELVELKNNGHTVKLSIKKGRIPKIRGGPLKSVYKFAQLHFHWGNDDTEGSENLINNSSFPVELHIVFFMESYGTFENALQHGDGLAVLSFLYSKSNIENRHYTVFDDALHHVYRLGSSKELHDFVSLDKFTTTHRHDYFTYEGSLTTPPCSEVVTWIEFKHTIPLSHDQIESFRHVSSEKGPLLHNFRPIQPLNGRIIRMNHPEKNFACKSGKNFLMTVIATLFMKLFR